MPLFIDTPQTHGPAARRERRARDADAIVIGVINNMADAALDATESQFNGLLRAAADARPVHVRYTSVPEVARGADAADKIATRYFSLDEFLAEPPDALIVTGAEPKAAALSAEPYWGRLCEVLDFAAQNLITSAWSCLAAHAAVQYLDGIERRRLATKRFGVFDHSVRNGHPLLRGLANEIRTPHSRWNNLPMESLAEAGYLIMTRSSNDEADIFFKVRGGSLFVFFQGHPEYEERTLLKEYQRDVARFISGEYREYPKLPAGYFDATAQALLAEFEQGVKQGKFPQPLAAFPFAAAARGARYDWNAAAVQVYRNWFEFIAENKRSA
jgi:homoserine O-succinyltransferase